MYTNFLQIRNMLNTIKPAVIAVASAHDESVLETVYETYMQGIANSILIGNKETILNIIDKKKYNFPIDIIDEKDDKQAALIAAKLVGTGKADILMKGLVNSSDFLKAVLDESSGLKTGRLLSHLAAFEIPGITKLAFYSDGGINLFPDLNTKKEIVINSIIAMHSIGILNPYVAVLTANEVINPKMPATVDAAALVQMNIEGKLPRCTLEGPISMDVALSLEAAAHKGIRSFISGLVDLFIVPNIEAGNMIGKTLIYYAGAKMAGVVLGAKCPIVMTSRAENSEGKLNSIALACLINNTKE